MKKTLLLFAFVVLAWSGLPTTEAEAIGLRSVPLKNFALEYVGAGN